MLEVLGSGYVIEHCIAALDELGKKKTFETYVTDCLKALTENTANKEEKRYMTTRYADMVFTDKKPKKEHTAEEVKADILGKLRNL